MKAKPERLDARVLREGLADDLRSARGLILSGRVLVDDQVRDKVGTPVKVDADVRLKGGARPFAGRGGLKLDAALAHFGVSVAEKAVLDAGACTGGFTDCLLRRGARRVYAVEVGHGQLLGRLAADPRVLSYERTNLGDVRREMLPDGLDLAVADLSYLSLAKALPQLCPLFDTPPEFVCLVKPLFEGVAPEAMQSSAEIERAVRGLVEHWRGAGLFLRDLMVSPVKGHRGTIELLAWVRGEDEGHTDAALTRGLRCLPSEEDCR